MSPLFHNFLCKWIQTFGREYVDFSNDERRENEECTGKFEMKFRKFTECFKYSKQLAQKIPNWVHLFIQQKLKIVISAFGLVLSTSFFSHKEMWSRKKPQQVGKYFSLFNQIQFSISLSLHFNRKSFLVFHYLWVIHRYLVGRENFSNIYFSSDSSHKLLELLL